MTLGKLATVLAAVTGGAVAGALGAVGAGHHAVAEPAQATISAPALTSADIADLRVRLDAVSDKLDRFNTRLSWLEGATSGALAPSHGAKSVP